MLLSKRLRIMATIVVALDAAVGVLEEEEEAEVVAAAVVEVEALAEA